MCHLVHIVIIVKYLNFGVKALPEHVKKIVGYSASKGRMYFKDGSDRAFLSSIDGKTVELAEALPTDVAAVPALVVKGDIASEVQNVHWSGALYHYKGVVQITFFSSNTFHGEY